MVYQGSKARIAKYIAPIIQKAINDSHANTFIDAFVGGANLIQHIKCENRIGYDLNPYLIAILNNLDKIPSIEVPISKELYDTCRAEWRSAQLTHPDWYIGAVGYITSFGGRFYDGGYCKDEYPSAPGRHEHSGRKNNILKQAPSLEGCQFEVKDFFSLKPKGAVIYCDPPYNGTKPYPYDHYTKDMFWNKVKELSKDNIVFVSELDASEDFECLWSKPIRNTVGADNTRMQTEKLFAIK